MQVDEKHCPLCGGDNHCKVNQTTICWCMTAKFPQDILERLPEESKGKQCICPNCINTYKGK